MGLKIGGIMLEGNRLSEVPSILKTFGLEVEDSLTEVSSATSMWDQAGLAHCAVALYGNWTVIMDPHGCPLSAEEETCADLSRQYDCRLAVATLYDVSNCYWFLMFDKGNLTRRFAYNDTEIDQEGDPLPEEAGTKDEEPDDKVLQILRGLGVNLIDPRKPSSVALEEGDRFFVCRSLEALPQERTRVAAKASERPWWKFW